MITNKFNVEEPMVPAGVSNNLFIRAVRYCHSNFIEPVVVFLESLSALATKHWIDRQMKDL